MSKIFISHSSANNAAALALAQWLGESGWDEYFLDITPARGLAPGERWQAALKSAADRCEAVLFLISPAWQASRWCLAEFLLARQLGKTIFGVVVEATPLETMPREMTAEWQLCDLVRGGDRRSFRVSLPPVVGDTEVSFAEDGLARLRIGLQRAGLDPASFPWPPQCDPNRLPYRGLKALEAEDAAVFFGREAAIVRGLDALRGLRDRGVESLFVILGASGAGKSSFLRAGLWPRLARDDRHFLPLPVIRPERAALSGATGLAASLEAAFRVRGVARSRAAINAALQQLGGLDRELADLQILVPQSGQDGPPPTVIIGIDQGEELFVGDRGIEARQFLDMMARTLSLPLPQRPLAVVAIRSDVYERLQTAPAFARLAPFLFSLPPVASSEFKAVVEGPARRHTDAGHRLTVESTLTERLVRDTEGADALPLLAFTLERLFISHGGAGKLCLDDYEALGGVRGSIEAAVDAAFAEPGRSPQVPADKSVRDRLLRVGFIPWLARVDPDTEEPKRRVVSWEEIPAESRPLLERLIEQRLLVRDRRKLEGREDAVVVEVAHEALLRQWPMLTEWLREDSVALKALDGVQRAAAEWVRNRHEADGGEAWLVHTDVRLAVTQRLQRPDFARLLGADGDAYLDHCRARDARLRVAKERELATAKALLEQAKALAEAQRQRADAEARARIRQRRLSSALAAFLALAVGAALYGWREQLAAKNEQRLAESGELAADALNSLNENPERSLLLALEAASLSSSAGGVSAKIQDALHRSLQAVRVRLTLRVRDRIVTAVAYSPTGALVATAHGSGVTLWDSVTGRESNTRFAGVGPVLGITFTPDGSRLVTAGRDGIARIWEVSSGREVSTLRGHTDSIWAVAVSPDGSRIATASQDNTIKLWDFDSAQLLHTFAGHSGAVTVAVFSPDGKLVASGGADGTVRIWDAASGHQLRPIDAGGYIRGVAFSPDGGRLATADIDARTVRFWEVASGRELDSWEGHSAAVFAVAYSPDGKQLATVSLDRTAKLWDVGTGKELFALTGHTDGIVSAAFDPSGNRLITGGEDSTARIWDVSQVAELPTLAGHTGLINQVVYSPDGKRLATASDDATVRIWEARSGQELKVLAEHHAAVNGVAFSPDGRRLATAHADRSARIFDVQSGRELFTLRGHHESVNAVAFSRNGLRLATGSSDKTVKIWDPNSGLELATLSIAAGKVNGVDLNADGSRVALALQLEHAGSGDSAQLWDWTSRTELLGLNGDDARVTQIVFSADARQLATSGATPPFAAKIWDVASGRETLTLSGHRGEVKTLAYSPDGKRLITGGEDASAKLWDTENGRELLDLPGLKGLVTSVAFSPDGKHLAAATDRTVRIHAVDSEELMTLARARVTGGLTDEECRRYLRQADCSTASTSLVIAGINLMKSGQRDAALAAFRSALDHDGVAHSEARARKLMATLLATEGSEHARAGDLVAAKEDFAAADALDP